MDRTKWSDDLIDARVATNRPLHFEAEGVSVHDLESSKPAIRFRHGDADHEVRCDFIAGCDGFHGICRPSIPDGILTVYERAYPFGWLGILAEAAPSSEELVYTLHERGFALFSMRSPKITRLYFQVPPEEPIDNWSDDAIWDEMLRRMTTQDGWKPNIGHIIQKSVTPMRSFVAAPMRHGRLFLAGDAAHIVPPTGAKGLNLAASDVLMLARAMKAFYEQGRSDWLDEYSEYLPAPGLEGAAVLVVDDIDAPSVSGRDRVRSPAPDCRFGLPYELACGHDEPGGAVRRVAAGNFLRIGRFVDP